MEKKYLILHGHFYQPPRENPWTNLVDRQISAYPFSDWNARIDQECYSSLTRTSVQDHDQILMMVNCFEYLSFNFGPTLLSWMEKQGSHNTIYKLVEADKISRIRNSGHGNAIAQVYNHIIMPLASEKDQYTQIIWGLKDFKRIFGRHSEGIWLSETAINNETAAILVDSGIKYVILSPYQAAKVIESTNNEFDVKGGSIDTSKPYKIKTKNGDLAAFFYDGYLASEISFGNMLASSTNLTNGIFNAFDKQHKSIKLVNIATDGEVYGHHKKFANMSLGRMIYDNVVNDSTFDITNYAKFLADYPPTDECELYLGDDGKGSSWSCAHGVGRWERDCSCHTGGQNGWNQKWRTPLRQAFDYLRDCIQDSAESYTKDKINNLYELRKDFLEIKRSNSHHDVKKVIEKYQLYPLNDFEVINIVKLLYSMYYSLLMYTSCGWFFSDLSGIETIQDMIYSYIAHEYAKEFLPPDIYSNYLEILSHAQSNIVDNGKQILERAIQDSIVSIDSIKEYVFWMIVFNGSTNSSLIDIDTITYKVIFEDEQHKRFVVHLYNNFGLDEYFAFGLVYQDDGSAKHIQWIKLDNDITQIESSKHELWEHPQTWHISVLLDLPISLRLLFVVHNLNHKMKDLQCEYGTMNFLMLNSFNGIENLLLPIEMKQLVFDYVSHIHELANRMKFNQIDYASVKIFTKQIELLKKSSEPFNNLQLYLDPIFKALELTLLNILNNRDIEKFGYTHNIYWIIKEFIPLNYIEIYRDILYRYYKKENNIENSNNKLFKIKLKAFMVDLGFLANSLN